MFLTVLGYSIGQVVVAVFCFGLLVVFLSYLAHLFAPAGGPPQYILDMEASQLLSGKESEAAEVAIAELVESTPEVTHTVSTRERIDDEVMKAYNSYKRQCIANRKKPLGLSRWLYNFDPDLYQRVFVYDD